MRGKSDSGKPRTLMYRFDFQAIQRENKHQLDSQQILLQELENNSKIILKITGGMIYAEEIERAVLGACLLERTAQSTALKSLRAEMFYITAHRAVFEAISALYARGAAVDMLTVCEELRASGRLDEAGGPFAVAKLAGEVATSAHLEYHCTILFQYFLRRRLVEVLTRELAAANDMTCDVYDVLIGTQRELGALLDDSPLENHLHPMPEVMEDTVALVDRRQELSVNGLTGVPTGLQRLNEMTGDGSRAT